MFVSSDGQGQEILRSQSSKSRMKVLEISDFNDEETWDYLRLMLSSTVVNKMEEELKNAISTVTGGRIINLLEVVRIILKNKPLSNATTEILNTAEEDLNDAGMNDSTDYRYNKLWELSILLLKKKSIPNSKAHDLLNNLYPKMRKSNVFSYHRDDDTITFQSTAHKTIVEKRLKQKNSNNFYNWLITNVLGYISR